MAELPLNEGIPRFKANESRLDRFANGGDGETWQTSNGVQVPSLRKFLKDTRAEIAVETLEFFDDASDGLLTQIDADADRAEVARGGSEAARNTSIDARDTALGYRDQALVARDAALAAAESSGNVLFFDTKALAEEGLIDIPTNGIVEIIADETRYGATTRYRKVAGALVFKSIVRYSQPELPIELFGNPDVDYDGCLSAAIDAAEALQATVTHRRGATYYSRTGVTKLDKDIRIRWNGSKVLRANDSADAPILTLDYSYSAPVSVVTIAATSLFAGYANSRLTVTTNFSNGATVKVADRTYTMVSVLGGANTVLIGANAQASVDNIVAAIMGAAGSGVTYGAGTAPHARVWAKRLTSTSVLSVTARAMAVPSIIWSHATSQAGASWSNTTASTSCHRIQFSAGDLATLDAQFGDGIKVFSDDMIPWGTGSDNERLGEMVDVACVEGVNIYTFRELRVSQFMSTNIRAAKMTKRTVMLDEPWFEDAPDAPITHRSYLLYIKNAVGPEVWQGKCFFGLASFLVFHSCLRNGAKFCHIENLRTSLAENANSFGYGVLDIGCSDVHHSNLYGRRVRHVYTTGASDIPVVPSADIMRYGGCVGGSIVDSEGDECEHVAFDTHPDACFIMFDNCRQKMNYRGHFAGVQGFQLRGWRNRIKGCHSMGPAALSVSIFNGYAEHDVEMTHERNPNATTSSAIVDVRSDPANPVRPRIRLDIRTRINDFDSPVISAEYCDIDVPRIEIESEYAGASTGGMFYMSNSQIRVEEAVLDLRKATGTSYRVMRAFGPNSKLYVERLRVKGPQSWAYADIANQLDCEAIFMDAECDTLHSFASDNGFTRFVAAGSAGATVFWAKTRMAKNAAPGGRFISYTANAGGPKTITWVGRGDNDLVLIVRNNFSGGTISVASISPPVHADQRLTLMVHESSVNSVVLSASMANANIVGPDITLVPRQSRRFFAYNGVWQLEQ